MATYRSRYAELGFYVDGEHRRFYLGGYKTDDADEIAVLDGLADADRVEDPQAVIATKEPEEPAAAPKAPRKPSAK